MRTLIATIKIAIFLLLCLGIIIPQKLVMLFSKGRISHIIPELWHKTVCAIFRFKIEIQGTPNTASQTMFMSNHISYLDIPILGATVKHTSFLAKKEVQSWPGFGFLADLQRTAYIERKSTAIKRESDKIKKRIDQNQNLILFPEGTSTDGIEVRDFKSSLFALALSGRNPGLRIQPVTIALQTTNGKKPETIEDRRLYTWPLEDDIEMPTHLWRFAKTKGACVRIIFHDTINPTDFENRKTLSKTCHDVVSKGLT